MIGPPGVLQVDTERPEPNPTSDHHDAECHHPTRVRDPPGEGSKGNRTSISKISICKKLPESSQAVSSCSRLNRFTVA